MSIWSANIFQIHSVQISPKWRQTLSGCLKERDIVLSSAHMVHSLRLGSSSWVLAGCGFFDSVTRSDLLVLSAVGGADAAVGLSP